MSGGFDPLGWAGSVLSSAGNLVSGAINTVGQIAGNILKNPLPVIETVALTAALGPGGLAVAGTDAGAYAIASAAANALNGGNIQQIALSAASAYAGGQLGNQLGTAVENSTIPFSQQTLQLAAQNTGLTQSTLQSIVTSSSGAAATAALMGKPIDQILQAGAAGAVSAEVNQQLIAQGFDPSKLDTKLITNASTSAANAIMGGKSVADALGMATTSTMLGAAVQNAGSEVKSLYNDFTNNSNQLNSLTSQYNSLQQTATDYFNNTLDPAQKTAQQQYDAAMAAQNTYNNTYSQYQDQLNAYNTAKDNYNNSSDYATSLGYAYLYNQDQDTYGWYKQVPAQNDQPAYTDWNNQFDPNTLIDAANAAATNVNNIVPTLQTQADAYNTAAQTYQATAANVQNLQSTYTGYTNQLNSLNSQIQPLVATVQQNATDLGTATQKFDTATTGVANDLVQQAATQATQTVLNSNAQSMGYTDYAQQQAATAAGFNSATAYNDATQAGFKDANTYNAATQAGFTNANDYTAAQSGGFADAATYDKALNAGFKDANTYNTATQAGFNDAATYNAATQAGYKDAASYQAAQAASNPVKDTSASTPTNITITGTSTTQPGTTNTPSTSTSSDVLAGLFGSGTPANDTNIVAQFGGASGNANLPGLWATGSTQEQQAAVQWADQVLNNPNATAADKAAAQNIQSLSGSSSGTQTSQTSNGTLSNVSQANQTALDNAKASGDQSLVQAVIDNNPSVIAALSNNDIVTAKSELASSQGGGGGALPVSSTGTGTGTNTIVADNTSTGTGTTGTGTTGTGTTGTGTTGTGTTGTGTTGTGTTGTGTTGTGTTGTGTGTGNLPSTNTSAQSYFDPKLDFTAHMTKGNQITLVGEPTYNTATAAPAASSPAPLSTQQQVAQILGTKDIGGGELAFAHGGLVQHFADGGAPVSLDPRLQHGNRGFLTPFTGALAHPATPQIGMPTFRAYAEGGEVEHTPQFYSEGGLNTLQNQFVQGPGDGTSDSVPAMLANGEFVIPADVVSKLGNGSNDSGAKVLSGFLASIREHAQDHDPKKLPPDSKGPLAYLLEAKKKVNQS